MKHKVRLLLLFVVLVLTGGCDQATKSIARDCLGDGSSHAVLGGLVTFTLARNPGAFLGLGALLPGGVRLAGALVALGALLALSWFVLRDRASTAPALLGTGFLLAGAGSNLIDRLWWHGKVTDFVVVGIGSLHTGVFNVADLAVMMGAGLIVWSNLRKGAI
ncbi:MAG TPA: signal peptidase II [Thermoanaerobaculaceae bacterium]|nr:signal peptidase II [Thermoanaerobaculaceae bacterium]